jgi:peptidyl-prolyl cis-trans isomerase SurA
MNRTQSFAPALRLAACFLLLPLLAWPTLGSAQTRELSTTGELVDRIAAVVNDGVVLNSELNTEIERITARLRERNTELPPRNVLRRQVLERLVVQEVQMQRADRIGMRVSDEMLNGTLEDVAQRNGVTFSQLPDALRTQGIDYRSFREEIRRDLTLQMLRQRDVISRINVSPRELDQFIARQKNMPDQTSEYNLSHILISVPQASTAEQVAAREARVNEVREKLNGGADFAQLALTYSDSGTNVEGGSLGWRKAA